MSFTSCKIMRGLTCIRIQSGILQDGSQKISRIIPQSPDLNPIELVWGKLKNMVEERRPKNKQELKDAILECWEEIPLSFIRNCIEGLLKKWTMRLRMQMKKSLKWRMNTKKTKGMTVLGTNTILNISDEDFEIDSESD